MVINKVVNLALGRGCLLRTDTAQGETIYWIENLYFTSKPPSCLEDLVLLLQTLPLLPQAEEALLLYNVE